MIYEIREATYDGIGFQKTNNRLCYVDDFKQAARVLVICTGDYIDEEDVNLNTVYPYRHNHSIKYYIEEFE